MKTLFITIALFGLISCDDERKPTSDDIQRAQQEAILQEGTSAVGMPAIKNFREKRLLKDIYEMRDNDALTTYTYIVAEMTGKLVYLGESVGYGIPAATEFTNPQKVEHHSGESGGGNVVMAQADPNGLFSPSSADGTWVMMVSPDHKSTLPVYIEPRCIVSPFRLDTP